MCAVPLLSWSLSRWHRYFIALIRLCAELCLERNQAAIVECEKCYPKDALLYLLTSEDLFPKVRPRRLCRARLGCIFSDRWRRFVDDLVTSLDFARTPRDVF